MVERTAGDGRRLGFSGLNMNAMPLRGQQFPGPPPQRASLPAPATRFRPPSPDSRIQSAPRNVGVLNAKQTRHGQSGFTARPNEDLGRTGPVCPFVPVARERKTLWLAPEHVGGCSTPEVAPSL